MYFTQAKWIWAADAPLGMQYCSFYTEYNTDSSKTTLEISCDTNCAIFLNDRFVSIGGLADYPDRKIYDTISLPSTPGCNHLMITVYHEGQSSSCYRLGTPCLRFAVSDEKQLLARSDETVLCTTDTGYQHHCNLITGQLGHSFAYHQPECFAACDQPVKVLSIDPTVYARPILPLQLKPRADAKIVAQGVFLDDFSITDPGERMQRAFLSARYLNTLCPEAVTAPLKLTGDGYSFTSRDKNGIYLIIDLGEESVGFLNLEIELPQKARIDIGFGEHLDDLRVRTSVGGRSFAAEVTLNAGKQQYQNYFRRFGLRYLQLHIHSDRCKLYYAGILPTEYPLQHHPIIRKDRLEQRITDLCVRTLELCMHEHYEDCPWREQALYTMDSRNQMLCGYYCFKEYDFAKYSLQLAAHSLRDDGLFELCSPGKVVITIPAFTLIFLKQVEEYLQYSEDIQTAKELFETGIKILDAMIARTEPNGMLRALPGKPIWNFYEWQTGLEGKILQNPDITGYDAPLCGFFGIALQSGIRLAQKFELTKQAKRYQEAFDALKNATDAMFWDREKQYYQSFIDKDGCKTNHFAQLTGALLLYAGMVPEEKQAVIRQKLSDDDTLHPVTLSHSIYRYEALLQDPTYQKAVKEEILSIWSKMVFSGSDTFWETADGAWAFDNAGSLCHGWSAIPLYIYAKYGLEDLDV